MSGGSYVRGEDGVMREPPGHAALWQHFGLSRAFWLCLPRVMMHEMPDNWQARMAKLLHEFDEHFEWPDELAGLHVTVRENGKFKPLPQWLGYRHPDYAKIESFRRNQ